MRTTADPTDSDGRPHPVAESFDDIVVVSSRATDRRESAESEPPFADEAAAARDDHRRAPAPLDATSVVWETTLPDPVREDSTASDGSEKWASEQRANEQRANHRTRTDRAGGDRVGTGPAGSGADPVGPGSGPSGSGPIRPLREPGVTDELTEADAARYANRALWPLCHSAVYRASFDADHWRAFREVNDRFAGAVADRVGGDTTVWFRGYRFALAPRAVREREPGAFLIHSLDVPWPSPDEFRACPRGRQLLEGLLANDLLGFARSRDRAQFLQCVGRELGSATVDWATGRVHRDDGVTTVETFPPTVDVDAVERATGETDNADGTFWRTFRRTHGVGADTTVAVGRDRLDFTSGVPERLAALERLFEARPDLRGEFTYVQLPGERPAAVPVCQCVREEVADGIRRLDERFGTDEWSPAVLASAASGDADRRSLYRHSDLAIDAPLRGGTGNTAEAFVAAQDDDGALLLGPSVAVPEDVSTAAVEFDPYDTSRAARALERALDMAPEERRTRMRTLRRAVTDPDRVPRSTAVLEAAEDVRSGRDASR